MRVVVLVLVSCAILSTTDPAQVYTSSRYTYQVSVILEYLTQYLLFRVGGVSCAARASPSRSASQVENKQFFFKRVCTTTAELHKVRQSKTKYRTKTRHIQHRSNILLLNLYISDNYSKFELPIAEGVNKIYISIDIDEVLFLAYLLSLFPQYPILDSQAIGNKSQTP